MKRDVVFLGTPEFAATVLRELAAPESNYHVTLAVSQPDRPQGRKQTLIPTPVHQLALEMDIPVFQPESAGDDDFYERLAAEKPDFLVTAAYGKILPRRVLDIARIEAVNVHASLLPKYRGAAPVQWSVINGDPRTGVSIMRMVEKMDAGPVFEQVSVEIGPNETAPELMDRLATLGAEVLPPTLDRIVDGLIPWEQDEEAVTHAAMMTRETGLIDWSKSAREIHNLVRGTFCWPCASTTLNGEPIKVHRTALPERPSDLWDTLPEQKRKSATPGMIMSCGGGRMLVNCGDPDKPGDLLEILELQTAGGKRLTAQVCAHNYMAGTSFGEC
ncbi:MAG: methionyl-tRNA formyltransferase [Fastidiosipilaceae bacterium]